MFLGERALADLIRTTADLIASEPLTITLKFQEFTRTPSGGQQRGPVQSRDPKERFFSGVTQDASYITRDEGEMVRGEFVLIGMPDDDMEEKDFFFVGARRFEIVEVENDRTFQCKAWVNEKH